MYDDNDVVHRTTIQRMCWLGHVVRMDEAAPVKKVFEMRVNVGR